MMRVKSNYFLLKQPRNHLDLKLLFSLLICFTTMLSTIGLMSFIGFIFRPIACDNDVKTTFAEANGPNVITGKVGVIVNFAIDSLGKSIYFHCYGYRP